MSRFTCVLTLVLLFVCPVLGQDQVKVYLEETGPIISRLKQSLAGLVDDVESLREDRDFAGMRDVALEHKADLSRLLQELEAIKPPPEGGKHHEALGALIEGQIERTEILATQMNTRQEILTEAKQLKAEGKSNEEIREFIKSQRDVTSELKEKTASVTAEIQKADDTLRVERKRLREL